MEGTALHLTSGKNFEKNSISNKYTHGLLNEMEHILSSCLIASSNNEDVNNANARNMIITVDKEKKKTFVE